MRSITSIAFLLIILSGLMAVGCSSKEKSEPIVLGTIEETREFVRNNLATPIPDSYDIPTYISSGLPLEQVYDSLARRYPDFYGLEGDTYLNAIMRNPERYLQMSLESKSIRRYYDPNSKY